MGSLARSSRRCLHRVGDAADYPFFSAIIFFTYLKYWLLLACMDYLFAAAYSLVYIVPLAVIGLVSFFVYKLITRNNQTTFGLKEISLISLFAATGVSGLVGIGILPFALVAYDDFFKGGALVSGTYLGFAVILLLIGLVLKNATGKFLMGLSVAVLIMAAAPVSSQLGSLSVALAVTLAFAALVAILVWFSRKAQNG